MLVLAADIPGKHLPGQGSKAQFLSYRQKPRPQQAGTSTLVASHPITVSRHVFGAVMTNILTPRRAVLTLPLVVAAAASLASCGSSDKSGKSEVFDITGTWKVSSGSYGIVSKGDVVSFNGSKTALFSPSDTYAFYQESGTYHLDLTGLLGSGNKFTVEVVNNDTIKLYLSKSSEPKLSLSRVS